LEKKNSFSIEKGIDDPVRRIDSGEGGEERTDAERKECHGSREDGTVKKGSHKVAGWGVYSYLERGLERRCRWGNYCRRNILLREGSKRKEKLEP